MSKDKGRSRSWLDSKSKRNKLRMRKLSRSSKRHKKQEERGKLGRSRTLKSWWIILCENFMALTMMQILARRPTLGLEMTTMVMRRIKKQQPEQILRAKRHSRKKSSEEGETRQKGPPKWTLEMGNKNPDVISQEIKISNHQTVNLKQGLLKKNQRNQLSQYWKRSP